MERNVSVKSKRIKWKGFIAKVLVFALIFTSIPFYREEKQMTVEAATDPEMAAATVIEIGSVSSFVETLVAYADDTTIYPNGIVMDLALVEGDTFDFSTVEVIPQIPEGKIWILMNGYNMLNVPMGMFDVGSKDGMIPETGEYTYYMSFTGGGSIHWNNYEDELQTVEAVTELIVDAGAKVVVSGVDMGTTNFAVRSGADLMVEGVDYSNPVGSSYTQYHCANEATYRFYEYVPMVDMNNEIGDAVSIVHYQKISEKLFTTDTGMMTECKVLEMTPSGMKDYIIGRYIYDAGALPSCITKLNYEFYSDEEYLYDVPAESFIVDKEYGIYSLSPEGDTMTFYGCNMDKLATVAKKTFTEGEGEAAVTKNIATMQVFRNFTPFILKETEDYGFAGKQLQATKVIFKEGSLPAQYMEYNWSTETCDYYDLEKIILYSSRMDYDLPGFIDFTFEIEQDRTFEIFNRSSSTVTATENVKVWVEFPTDEYYYSDQYVSVDLSNLVVGFDGIDSYYYALAGSYVTLTPVEGYTFSNIELGGWNYDQETDIYTYDNGRRANKFITHYTNGSKKLTVPNFYCNYSAVVEEISEVAIKNNETSSEVVFSKEPVYQGAISEESTEKVDWYNEDFTITGASMEGTGEESTETHYYKYLICDEETAYSTTSSEWSGKEISISEEGVGVTQKFKLINLTEKLTRDIYDEDFDGDTLEDIRIPAEGYGTESWVTYTYVLDKTSPMITDVTVTDAKGNELELNGGWYNGTGDKPEAATVWSMASPVSVEIQAEDNASGVSEYLFGGLTDVAWGESVQAEVTEDGEYSLALQVRDKIESYTETSGDGQWITAFGIDTVAPVVHYTDALNAENTELKTNGIYQGNLYLELIEETSGINYIQLFEQTDGVWMENSSALIKVAASETTGIERYCIIPTDTDNIYRIVVTDVAGNETIYDNLTLKGYEQDIQVTLGVAEAVYGETWTLPVTIENISTDTVQINELALREGISDTVFELSDPEITELAAGEKVEMTVSLPKGTNAGEYETVLDITYANISDNVHLAMEKAYSETITATIEKAEGVASFEIADFYYGETINLIYESATNSNEDVTILYKDKNDETAVYSSEEPTAVGSYQAKIEFPENENYELLTVETTFEITRLAANEEMYTVTEADGKDGWYTTDVVITATDGNQLATAEDGTYASSLTIKESVKIYTFYVKTATGAVTEEVVLENIRIDHTAPEISENEGIYAGKKWWQTFLETITFGIYQTEEETIQIKAHDNESDIREISYYISDDAMTLEEVEALEEWIVADTFTMDITEERDYVVYAKVENNAGLVTYLSSNGIMVRNEEIQYLTVTADEVTGIYGKEIDVVVTINNTSDKPLTIESMELNKEVSSEEFVLGELAGREIAANEKAEVTLKLPAETVVGNYTADLEIAYSLQGSNESTRIEKALSQTVTAVVEAAVGTAELTIADIYYGETLKPVVKSETNGIENVEFLYKSATEAGAEYSEEVPTAVGNYYIKATFPATENYTEVVLEKLFEIISLVADETMYTVTEASGKDGWYTTDVIITATDGNQLATTEDGTYASSLTIKESVEGYTFYVKTSTGAITEVVKLPDIRIDRTAPEIGEEEGIYAVKTWWQTFRESISFGIYQTEEETIQIKAHDNESDIREISYYISNDAMTLEEVEALEIEKWIVADTFTMDISEERDYVVYAKVENNAGLVTYLSSDGIMVRNEGIQYITVTANEVPGTYGTETSLTVVITNNSEKVVTIESIVLKEETSSAEFVLGTLENSQIPVGGKDELILTLPAETVVGNYTADLEITYSLQGSNESTTIEKTYGNTVTAVVGQAEGTANVTVDDIYYGETFNPIAESETNGAEAVTFMYKSATDTEYTTEIPTAVGSYYIKAIFPATANYKEVVVEKNFEIKRLAASKEMYTISEADGKDGWYTGDITITATGGNQLATEENGAYASSLTIKESAESYSFYVKTSTGAITEEVVLSNIKIDRTAPEISDNEGIYAGKKWWQTFLETITFGIYQTEEETIQIKAHDDESGIESISYYVSEKAMTLEEIKTVETWTVGTEFVMNVDIPKNYVIYARLENEAGLVTYLSTDGIVIESSEQDTEIPDDTELPEGPVDGKVSAEGKVYLKSGTEYKLGEGNWSVSGDDTVYAGGITFYVLEDGEYDFKVAN